MVGYNKLNIDDAIKSGQILASALYLSKKLIQPGITTKELNSSIEKFILSKKAIPSFKGLNGYPYSTCISINEQVVHGTPSNKKIKSGDIITVDIGVSYNNHCTDAARTFTVGETNNKILHMIKTAHLALNSGILKALPDNRVGDISYSIQSHIFNGRYKTTLEYGGHGIGLVPHTNPFIPNYGQKNTGPKIKRGKCLAIEPILISGSNEVSIDKDGWTIYSPHRCLSVHVEDTIIVADSPIILTRRTLDGDTI